MPGKRRSATKHVGSGGAVAMVIAVLVTLLAGWAAYGMVSGDEGTVSGSGGETSTTGDRASGESPVDACAAEVSKASKVVAAASINFRLTMRWDDNNWEVDDLRVAQ